MTEPNGQHDTHEAGRLRTRMIDAKTEKLLPEYEAKGSPTSYLVDRVLGAVVVAALALLAVTGRASVLSPYPILVLVPVFMVGRSAVILPVVAFWLWTLPPDRTGTPMRSAVALGLLTAATPLWFVMAWRTGLAETELAHMAVMIVLNAAILAGLWYLLVRGRRKPSARRSLQFHVAMFTWLAWAAFPVLDGFP
jgi:hypothetical protein